MIDKAQADKLAEFLGTLLCEDCDRRADWEAIAPSKVVRACDQHLGILLDDNYVWFVTPLK